MLGTGVIEALESMTPGAHAILVYDTKEHKQDVLFTHLKLGSQNDGLVYVCAEESPAEAVVNMREFGMDVDDRITNGTMLVKNFDEVYIVKGNVDSSRIARGFSDLAREYSNRGQSLRASAEMSCFFDKQMVPELIAYERALHRRLSFPAMGLCGYNLLKMYNSGNMESLWPVLKAHGLVIMTGPGGSLAMTPDEVRPDDLRKTMGTFETVGPFETVFSTIRDAR